MVLGTRSIDSSSMHGVAAILRRKRVRSGGRSPAHGGFTTCTATYLNGAGIGMAIIPWSKLLILPDHLRDNIACCVAVPGTASPSTFVPLTVAGPNPRARAMISGCGFVSVQNESFQHLM